MTKPTSAHSALRCAAARIGMAARPGGLAISYAARPPGAGLTTTRAYEVRCASDRGAIEDLTRGVSWADSRLAASVAHGAKRTRRL